eukprot:TRINITY_DN39310_c0_g1_i3.p1 TRINITY_DN39310_c0_g1~~TRINITY_DN39310_c0_g1_i3.p1  ORF type:complete len:665 (-),score=136.89 TRINITY_DN39310_c0_g1_i3:36-2030(-)
MASEQARKDAWNMRPRLLRRSSASKAQQLLSAVAPEGAAEDRRCLQLPRLLGRPAVSAPDAQQHLFAAALPGAVEEHSPAAASPSRGATNGVCVSWLQTGFWDEIEASGCGRSARFLDIRRKLLQVRGQEEFSSEDMNMMKSGSYVDSLDRRFVGPPRLLVSHTWSAGVADVLECLLEFCVLRSLRQDSTPVWMRSLCQKIGSEDDSEWCLEALQLQLVHVMTRIEHVLVVATPWEQPAFLRDAWCLFEFETAMQCDRKTIIVAPQHDRDQLSQALPHGATADVLEPASKLRVQDAEMRYLPPGARLFKSSETASEDGREGRALASANAALRRRLQGELLASLIVPACEAALQQGLQVDAWDVVDVSQYLLIHTLEADRAYHLLAALVEQLQPARRLLGEALFWQGWAQQCQHKMAAAVAKYAAAATVLADCSDCPEATVDTASTLDAAGLALLCLGRREEAAQFFTEASAAASAEGGASDTLAWQLAHDPRLRGAVSSDVFHTRVEREALGCQPWAGGRAASSGAISSASVSWMEGRFLREAGQHEKACGWNDGLGFACLLADIGVQCINLQEPNQAVHYLNHALLVFSELQESDHPVCLRTARQLAALPVDGRDSWLDELRKEAEAEAAADVSRSSLRGHQRGGCQISQWPVLKLRATSRVR